jgi:hypothetical protein
MAPTDRVLVELLIAAPIDAVWRALRDPKEIARWFGWDTPTLGEEIDMIFITDVEASEATHTFATAGLGDRYTLEAAGPEATIVRVIRSAPVTDKGWQNVYDDSIEGWRHFAEQLRFLLQRHPGADRRTLFFNGRIPGADVPPPAEALGLARLATVAIGQRYAVKTAMGDTLEGEVWFRSPNMLGLTVDGFGDGLLVASTRTTTAKSPHGGGTLCITTYGFDDAKVAAMRDRWSEWWRGRYEVIEIHP